MLEVTLLSLLFGIIYGSHLVSFMSWHKESQIVDDMYMYSLLHTHTHAHAHAHTHTHLVHLEFVCSPSKKTLNQWPSALHTR